MSSFKSEPSKILIIQTAFIGDVILVTPLIRAIKNCFPLSEICALTIPECVSIIDNQVENTIALPKKEKKNRTENLRNTIDRVKSEKFDIAFIPHRSFRSGYLAFKAGIPERIGFDRGGGRYFHTYRVPYDYNLYEGQRNLSLLKHFFPITDSGLPQVIPKEEDVKFIDRLISERHLEKAKFAVIAPGSVWRTKMWNEAYYIELIRRLTDEHGIECLLIGGKTDYALCSRIAPSEQNNLAGSLTILQSAELIRRAIFTISGDSAPAHLATAMQSRQVIIFGSTAPRFGFFPHTEKAIIAGADLWCRPCTNHGRKKCPLDNSIPCMSGINPRYILKKIEHWLY